MVSSEPAAFQENTAAPLLGTNAAWVAALFIGSLNVMTMVSVAGVSFVAPSAGVMLMMVGGRLSTQAPLTQLLELPQALPHAPQLEGSFLEMQKPQNW